MKKIVLLIFFLPVLCFADLPPVTGLRLSAQTTEWWVQTAMRDGDSNLYEISCQIGYTNWSFVGGGTNWLVPIYTDPLGQVIRDPGHIYYQGRYYLVYNCEKYSMGVAVSDDDTHWTYAGNASVGPGPHWSPKFFIDATNCLWCNVRYCYGLPDVYPYQQFCYRFDTSNPTNTANRDGRLICTNIWLEDNSDFPTAQIVCNNGLFYLFNQGGNVYCSPTLQSNNWAQIGTNLYGQTMDGPCVAPYQGVWYITDSQNGSDEWFRSLDLTNWSSSTMAGWTDFGLKEGTAVIHSSTTGMLTLNWQPNYSDSSQTTEILASDDLTRPSSQWTVVYTGTTNQCILTNDRPVRFFTAVNIATNSP